MKFEQQVTTEASREALWAVLSDFQRTARCLPGIEDVHQVDSLTYQGTMRIRLGPMGFNFSGTIELEQDEKEGRWSMRAHAQDRRVGAGFRAIIEAALTEPGPGLAGLRVSADVQFMGRLGELGQPLIKRKADAMFQEFAENLKRLAAVEA